jgi:hypothetical protein
MAGIREAAVEDLWRRARVAMVGRVYRRPGVRWGLEVVFVGSYARVTGVGRSWPRQREFSMGKGREGKHGGASNSSRRFAVACRYRWWLLVLAKSALDPWSLDPGI